MAMVRAALERQAERYGKDPDTDRWAPRPQRLADALVDLTTAARPSTAADRATAVVHIDWDNLAGHCDDDAYLDLPFAAGLAATEARAMACDGRLDIWLQHPDGATIGIGRTSQSWPPWLYRKIIHRDMGCRWPGCSNEIGLHVHHEKPYGQGGTTDTKGGFCLCNRHHHIRHKPGWQITGDPDDQLTFTRPDGTTLPPSRPPLHPQLKAKVA
ncbi:MAG: HNH endonuclease [Acidimicrobiia bacterium]|nr:HNH endonuclease [Acidimicrobiia bacterium]